MQKRNFIFGGFAGLLFMVFVAVNLTLSYSSQREKGFSNLSLTELLAKAESGGEDYCTYAYD